MTHSTQGPVTPLRQRMIEDMTLSGLSARTQQVYIYGVRGLAAHYKRSPDLLTEEDVRTVPIRLTHAPTRDDCVRKRIVSHDILDRTDLPSRSLPEFQRLLPDDATCAAYLEKARWVTVRLPHCGVVSEPVPIRLTHTPTRDRLCA